MTASRGSSRRSHIPRHAVAPLGARRRGGLCDALAVVIAVIVANVGARPAGAQVSPGPLARAHQSLEGVRNCTQCHGVRREPVSDRCVACHREITWLQEQRRGFHARTPAGATCQSCHPDHAGAGFNLISWPDRTPERFDHRRAGWALEGAHAEARCASCHDATLRVSPAARLSPRKNGAGWVGLERNCVSCHDDPHRGALESNCESCHDLRDWKPAPKFDHADTDYKLTGKHADVKCSACHLTPRLVARAAALRARPPRGITTRTPPDSIPVFSPVPYAECSSCHRDPHAGRFSATCSRCHVTRGFDVIPKGSFDHSRTRYPLRGRHAAVACESCHGPALARKTPAFATCTSCHTDAHGGQLAARSGGACETCHTVGGWRPSTFTAAAHARTRFPLTGRHLGAPCAACHTPPGDRSAADVMRLGTARVAFTLGDDSDCASCHIDPHAGAPATARTAGGARAAMQDCRACHGVDVFRPSSVDVSSHRRFAFRLEGAHAAVPCVSCHQELKAAPARSTVRGVTASLPRMTFAARHETCSACHATPHGDQFAGRPDGGACESCHAVTSFTPAAGFVHDRDTRFPLRGAHAGVACASCHRSEQAGGGAARVVYRPVSRTCESCHAIGKPG